MLSRFFRALFFVSTCLLLNCAWAKSACPARSELKDSIHYSLCKSIGSDNQVHFYSESSLYLFPSQTVLTVKGHIRTQDHDEVFFQQETEIPDAVFRVQYPHRPTKLATANFESLTPDRKEIASFLIYNPQLTYGKVALTNGTKKSERIQGYSVIANKYSSPYLLPEKKLLPFNPWDMQCENIEGEIPVIQTCELIEEAHSSNCECSYRIK